MQRIVLHVDLDSFYAQVEMVRQPELQDKPVVVGMFSRDEYSGAVATANYKARELGIRSALPLRTAHERATEDTVFLPADKTYYNEVSDRVMAIIAEYGDAFESISVDEAYIEVTERCEGNFQKAQLLAQRMKQDIWQAEALTCSVGIGSNKLVAKMASDADKPDGLTVVRPEEAQAFLAPLSVEELYSVGPKTATVLREHNMETIGDIAAAEPQRLVHVFGQNRAQELQQFAQAIDERVVAQQDKKQLSRITTLAEDTRDVATICSVIERLAADVCERLVAHGVQGKTITFIAMSTERDAYTRSQTIAQPCADTTTVAQTCSDLAETFLAEHDAVLRRIGVRVSHFVSSGAGQSAQTSLSSFAS